MFRKKWLYLAFAVLFLLFSISIVDSALNSSSEPMIERYEANQVVEVDIQDYNTRVEVIASENDQVVLHYPQTRNGAYKTNLDAQGKLSLIRTKKSNGFLPFNFRFEKIVLELPKEINFVSIQTSNGLIMMKEVDVKQAWIKTTNGKVDLEKVKASSLELSTVNGEVVTNQVVADSIHASTTNGQVKLIQSDVQNRLVATTTNGNVKVGLIGMSSKYRVSCRTTNGKCNVPENSGEVLVDVSTTNGNVTVEFDQ